MKRQTRDILAITDPETVAEALDMDTRRMGSRISVLCPVHDDTHHGSCFLTQSGFHCFACGAHGDVIAMVRAALHCSFDEACNFLESIYGLSANYNRTIVKPILSDRELRLIGLMPDKETQGISVARYLSSSFVDQNTLSKGCHVSFAPFHILGSDKRNAEVAGFSIVSETLDKHPLRTLLEEDEASYRILIAEKAEEAIGIWKELLEIYKRSGEVDLVSTILKNIRDCEDIRAMYTDATKDQPKRKPKHQFNIKRGDSI